jgi:sulfur carrier protein
LGQTLARVPGDARTLDLAHAPQQKQKTPMQITVNGEIREVPSGVSVRALVELLGLTEGPVAVERNREVVPRAEHTSTELCSGDVVEIVHFVGGG